MILSAQSIDKRVIGLTPLGTPKEGWLLGIEPYVNTSKQACGMSYGLTAAGYDIRIGEGLSKRFQGDWIHPGEFLLVASLERVKIPNDLQVIVHDKSSWARQGLALQNTVLEPGWEGYITLELSNHGKKALRLMRGQPIAQLVFHQLDAPTILPYTGKYQNQGPEPEEAIMRFDTVEELMHDLNDGEDSDTTKPTE